MATSIAGLMAATTGFQPMAMSASHRRLSIVDLSTLANQPMSSEDGKVWLTYNGEVYNHASLRPELIAAGHTFRTDRSDTEVLVCGFEQWGIDGQLQRSPAISPSACMTRATASA